MQISVTEYLDRTAERFPDKTAIDDIKSTLTFAQFRNNALALAAKISEFSLSESPIPVFMPKSCEAVTAFAAINYSGNFYVPMDTKSPESRIKSILDSLEAKLVITNAANEAKLKSVFDGAVITTDSTFHSSLFTFHSSLDVSPVYSIFTSGSTGVPKGVVISHRGVIDYIDWAVETFKIDETTVIANQAPFYFDNSTLDIYLMFATGATLVVVPEEYYAFPARLMDLLNEKRINFVFWVPSVLVNIANYKLLEQKKPQYLTKILFAGEVMPNKHLNYWRRNLPDCLYANLYGPTEITVDCTYYIVDREFADEEPLPIGIPCRNSGILILNDENRLAATGEAGELCVRGSSLALGYYNAPEKTASAFVQNPLNPHYPETIYRTGDIACWNERGEIIYIGRRDFQVKHNGYRIELGEIENAVAGTALVDSCCVVYDREKKEIALFYIAGEELNIGEFRRRMLQFVPKYMTPTKYRRIDAFPLSANGKIDRMKLATML
jgi:amino acid adenylation domain-containing protein